ncbi:MAG: hypothetical protein ACE366_13160 [Bradymonadia bacterium]
MMRNLLTALTFALPAGVSGQGPSPQITPVVGAPAPAPRPAPEVPPPVGEPGATATEGCKIDRTLTLQPGDFTLDAYDAQDQVLRIHVTNPLLPSQAAARPAPVRLDVPAHDHSVRLPLAPEAFQDALEAHQSGHLVATLSVKQHTATEEDCLVKIDGLKSRLMVRQVSDETEPIERDLRPGRVVTRVPMGKVRVGRVQVDAGSAPERPEVLSQALMHVGQSCMEQALRSRPVVNGSLHIQIERSPTGTLRAPQVVVDGLACPFVSECLTHSIEATETATTLQESLPEGTRVFVPFFFKGAVEERVVSGQGAE